MQKEFFKRNKSWESRKRLSLTGNIWKFSIWFMIYNRNPEMSDESRNEWYYFLYFASKIWERKWIYIFLQKEKKMNIYFSAKRKTKWMNYIFCKKKRKWIYIFLQKEKKMDELYFLQKEKKMDELYFLQKEKKMDIYFSAKGKAKRWKVEKYWITHFGLMLFLYFARKKKRKWIYIFLQKEKKMNIYFSAKEKQKDEK